MTNTTNKKRPLSPHLSIYKPQISTFTSIMHRISGFGIYICFSALVWWIILAASSDFSAESVEIFDFMHDSVLGQIILFFWYLGLVYHLLNGIRHLFWDIGYGFELDIMNKTGIAVIALTILITLYIYAGVIF